MKPKILLVRKEAGSKSSFHSIIENDFDVVEVIPWSAALTTLEAVVPDLVVLERGLNDPKAHEVCRQIKFSENYHFIPVVFTGYALSRKEKVKLIESGANDCFTEPFDTIDTMAHLRALLKKEWHCKYLVERYNELKKEVAGKKKVQPRCSDPENEDFLRITFEQSAVGIAQADTAGNFLRVNARFCEIVGYSREELLSKNFRDITHPYSKDIEEKMVARILAGEIDSYEIEKKYVHKQGHPVWIKLYSTAVRDESGSIKYAIATVADISRQKKVEASLYESEAFFRAMYESSGIGIGRISVHDKRIEQANDAFCRMLGYTEDELIGKPLREISYAEDLPENIEQLKKLATGQISSIQMEKRYLHKDGHPVWGLLRANLIFDEAGNPLYFIGNILDITESKKSQEMLKQSEEKYRTYVDNSPHPIFAGNASGRFLDANPAACDLTGYSREELTNMSFWDLLAPESMEAAEKSYKKVMTEGKTFTELLFLKKDGTPFYMQSEAVRIDENTFLGLCVDTTERKMAEKLLVEARLLAEDASRSKSEFLANVNHELRTPLNIVLGYSDILLEGELGGELNEKQRKFTDNINNAGKTLLEIVDSLIDIAELGNGKGELMISEFDLPSLVSDMHKMIIPLAARKNIRIEFIIGDDIGTVYADMFKFKLILHHLVENSIKFTPDNGNVKVSMTRSENDLRISVEDNGIGIPESDQEKLFEPFVQLGWSLTRKYGGVGLGLPLVKNLVGMHGGTIDVKSKVGVGSTFTFTIPQDISANNVNPGTGKWVCQLW